MRNGHMRLVEQRFDGAHDLFVVDAGGYDTIQSPIKSDIWIKQVVNDGQIVFIPDFFEPVFQQSAVFHFREVSHSDICGRRHLQACYI